MYCETDGKMIEQNKRKGMELVAAAAKKPRTDLVVSVS